MRRIPPKNRCVWCGDSFATEADYEEHLETCDSNPERRKLRYIVDRLKEAAEEFK